MAQFQLCASTIFMLFTLYGKIEANPLRGATVEPAGAREFPFVVSLGYFEVIDQSQRYLNHFCGGSLITQKHVLTAEHCLTKKNKKPSEVFVTVGSVDLNKGKLYPIASWITYKDWANKNNISMEYSSNDIAIVVLSKNVTDEIVPVVRSNISDLSIARKKVVTAGWGRLVDNSRPQFLQKAYLRVLTVQECAFNIFQLFGTGEIMPENLYCTTASKNAMEFPVNLGCGDSGGPLLLKDTNEIVGVNKAACDVENANTNPYATNLHVQVIYYKSFIDDVLKKIKDDPQCS